MLACEVGVGDCFTLLGVVVDGAQAFTQTELAPLYADYLTQNVSQSDLARIAQKITDHYRRAGYFLSRAEVPPQSSHGIAHINVIEGRITSLVVEGDGAHLVETYLRGLDRADIADLADMDRRLALAGDVPGIRVRSRMEPDLSDPAAHRLIVTADLQSVEASGGVDNRGEEDVGPLQAYGRVGFNAVTGLRDRFGIAVFATPEDANEFAFAEFSYGRTFENGRRAFAALSASRARAAAPTNGADGDGYALSVGFEHPLLRRRDRGLWLGATLDLRHQENDWFGGGGYADELRVARVSLRGFLDDEGRSSWVFVQTSFGLDALGASGMSAARRSRWDADASFAKLDFFASHYQPLGRYFGLYGALAGQWADEPLLQSEEFSAGALPFGRAYAYGEISGDRGVGSSLEFRAGAAPGIDTISFVQGYLFVDGAEVWNETGASASIGSLGGGLRLTFDDKYTAAVELARPIDGVPLAEGDNDWRQYFSLSANY